MPVLLITGSRDGHPRVRAVLDRWVAKHGAPHLVVLGDADGVDRAALEWCIERGHFFVAWCADWQRYGRAAGPVRNGNMVVFANPGAHCIAFPVGKGPGTRGCMELACMTGLEVFEIDMQGRPRRFERDGK